MALRLAQAGKSVLVVERGRRYRPGEFPRDVRDVDALLWRYPRRPRSRGLFDLRFLSGMGTVVASGVGGGSLIYASIHIRPDAVVFDDPRWPEGTTRESLEPYYDRVAEAFRVAPVPASVRLPKRDAFREAAARAGRTPFDPDQAVSWTESPGPGREPCRHVTQCEFGCQYGAKRTVDLTQLAAAEELGAEVRTSTVVTHVEPVPGGHRAHFRDLESGEPRSATGTRVVLAAGTLGTNELLLRSRASGLLPRLSHLLGVGFSGNGDFLGSIHGAARDLEPWVGPDVTTVIPYFDRVPRFTMAAPTFNREVMEVIAGLGQGSGRLVRPLGGLLWALLPSLVPWVLRRGLLGAPGRPPRRTKSDPARVTNLFAIGQDNAGGRLRLRRGSLDVVWDYRRENAALVERMSSSMAELARLYGGTYAPIPTWSVCRKPVTVHCLGGCRLGASPSAGVVDPRGEVYGHPGLYVADGSVVPTAIGFHPVMTIAALAERTSDAIVDGYPGA